MVSEAILAIFCLSGFTFPCQALDVPFLKVKKRTSRGPDLIKNQLKGHGGG